jgi:hypothetical protein
VSAPDSSIARTSAATLQSERSGGCVPTGPYWGSATTGGPPVAAPKAPANLSADEVNLVGCSVEEDFARVLRARQVGGGDPVTGV